MPEGISAGVVLISWLEILRTSLPQNKSGVSYSRPISGTGMPPKGAFRHAFSGRALSAAFGVLEITSFEMDLRLKLAKMFVV